MKLNEIDDIVYNINQEFQEKSGIEDFNLLDLSSSGYVHVIVCLGSRIWDSDTDDRKFLGIDEDDYEQEPLEVYLKREIENRIRLINAGFFGHSKFIDPKDFTI